MYKEKRQQRKMTKYYYWIGVQENISIFSKSKSDCNSLIQLPLFDRSASQCLLNCHTHAMTGNCSASQQVLAYSLGVVSAREEI